MSNETSYRRRRHLTEFLLTNGFELVSSTKGEQGPPDNEIWERRQGISLTTLSMYSFTSADRDTVRGLLRPSYAATHPGTGKPFKESETFPLVTTDNTIVFDVKPVRDIAA